ncbi:MAG TPA: hypothetical protein DCG19_05590 [Cryomorphaceae bacterium]|nr:hypothetical protein [Owenweeksia sp.]MBF98831.1 hypothetical protein [Owenweeksia sp.]HAD96858.1 hypothetical protein [Cryomorphaceae bacterium]HCQ16194.1 hypothetical protein [Cryomorphaceae bacterium]
MFTQIGRWIKEAWYFLPSFFPVQLFLLHLRRSHILMIFWLLLFLFVNRALGVNYGFPYLFLTPEYLDKVNFLSYFLVGLTAGLFVMSYHISSYIYYSYRYTFLATLSRPLWKFCINNSVIPLLFFTTYLYQTVNILLHEGYSTLTILVNISGLLSGAMIIISLMFTYFFSTIRTLELPDEKGKERGSIKPLKGIVKKDKELRESVLENQSVVNHYLKNPFQVKLARGATHYQHEKLLETIQQHHVSASALFILLILLVIGLSMVSGNRPFMIPAGATIFLIFSLYLMITGAFYSRLKTWTLTIGIVGLLILNYLSGLPPFRTLNYAYGMDYTVEPAHYNYDNLSVFTTDSIIQYDREKALNSLKKWRSKFSRFKKPKLIILNVSGGGMRSTLWTMRVLQEADSITGGDLFRHSHLITGSSGGMLGAAYFRELKYRYTNKLIDKSPYHQDFLFNTAKDALNPVAFTLAVNDLFFRFRKVEYAGHTYPMDRGYAFDRKFSKNTGGVLDKSLGQYKQLEMESEMPTMILGPTIIGDGRKLLMSSQNFSFLTYTTPFEGTRKVREYDAVEYQRLFAGQSPDNLSFLTALRLSASFPYITPLVNLPSEPSIELIDAGVRDNEGMELALRYLYEFRDWIRNNTDGVAIVQIKANRPDEIPISDEGQTKLDQLVQPINGVVKSFHNLQIYNKSLLMQWSEELLPFTVDVVRFSLFEKKDEVSLSWHLTENEKRSIISTLENETNQAALKEVRELLKM